MNGYGIIIHNISYHRAKIHQKMSRIFRVPKKKLGSYNNNEIHTDYNLLNKI